MDSPAKIPLDAPAPLATVNSLPGFSPLTGRVLVAEDDRVNQHMVKLILDRLGLQSTLADNGEIALQHVTQSSWDAVLMDCQMPVMNGFEATRAIRAHLGDRRLPIIALTANTSVEDRAACTAAGMDDFLAKPVRRDALYACLKKWLQE